MLLRLLAGLSLIGAIISAVAAITTGFELSYVALAVSGVFSFAVLIAASDAVDHLATIARNTEQKPFHAQPPNRSSDHGIQTVPTSKDRSKSASFIDETPDSVTEYLGKKITKKGNYFYVDDVDFTSEWRAKAHIDGSSK